MLNIVFVKSFKKDYKRAIKRGLSISKIDDIIRKLSRGESLPPKNKDHKLYNNYIGKRECHIEPDWLLIYEVTEEELILYGTGSHAYLFD